MRKFLALLAALSLSVPAVALDTAPGIFDPTFRTLKIQRSDNFFLPPVISLRGDEALTVTFDRLGEDRYFLRYRLLHCNADWQPSGLVESEYLSGFNDLAIEDYAFSQNTFVHFLNYRIELPAEELRPLVSGNYLLQVYDEQDPGETLLQARFCVSEGAVEIMAQADSQTDRGLNGEFQQLDVILDTGQTAIRNPYSDITLTVEQNAVPGTDAVVIRNPQRVQGNRVIYEHLNELIFPAGNEFRRFETVRADYPGMNVDSVRYVGPGYHAYLRRDRPGRDRSYSYDQTQSGRFMVREYNATDADLGADYVTVHFTLEMPEIIDAEVYVEGEMTLGRYSAQNRMRYDRDRHAYTLEMPLKQGSYNYRYVVKSAAGTDPYFIDGNKYETRNEYTVKAYVRQPGERADRLLGTTTITAFQ